MSNLRYSQVLAREISGAQAWRSADRLPQYNRIQASPGFRAAAEDVIRLLSRDGVEAKLDSYPAQDDVDFLGRRSFAEWNCRGAELWLLGEDGEPTRRLCRFQQQEVSLVQRSGPTPPGGVKAELVYVPNAENPDSYQGLDLKGKIALVRGNAMAVYTLAVEVHGAIGLVFDNLNEYPPIRYRADMPDAIQYTSFWWRGHEDKVFGFCVSPRTGDELRQLLDKGPVRLYANVEAEFYPGSLEVVEFFIPGRQQEEVLLIAHLCHPYPGAQDNASGPAVLMEVMRALNKLVAEGELEPPQLGIRFLLVPEMTGTYAWLDRHHRRREKIVAALNMDMVGADQGKGGGPLCVEQPPLATPTFVDRYAYALLDSISRDITNFSGTDRYSTCYYLQTRFSGGSDHYILSDPAIGIPCPMLIQWPDRHYHTSLDEPSNLAPDMLARVAQVAALYAWGLAAGEEEHWLEFAVRDGAARHEHLRRVMEWVFGSASLRASWREALDFYYAYELKALAELRKYARLRGFDRLEQKADRMGELVQADAEQLLVWARERAPIAGHGQEEKSLDPNWAARVYGRVYPVPAHLQGELAALPASERLEWGRIFREAKAGSYSDFLEYWLDGRRPLGEVLELVKLETGRWLPDFAIQYIQLGERLGFLRRVR